jgi:hypothetical protein
MDLTPLAEDDELDVKEYVKAQMQRFEKNVTDEL